MVTVTVLATLLTGAGCAAGSGGTADSRDEDAPPKTSAGSLTWEFEHIADFSGKITDVAALAEDDVWAVATENDGESSAHLLHYDGTRWKREALPEALGSSLYPPALEEIGTKTLWLRPHTADGASGVNRWAQWDGTRWSSVPNPPPGSADDFEATGPDDIWTLDTGEQTAHHWNGTRWTAGRLPYGAADLAIAGPADVWAVGSRSTGPGTDMGTGEGYSQPASMHWDGTS
ncbi:hypothetical protein ACFC18_55410, partial [Streptomyces sp. NPDC056121]